MSGDDAMMTGAAGRYASALFDLARDADAIDTVAADLETLAAAIAGDEALARALKSPMHAVSEKAGVLAALAKAGKFHKLTGDAMQVAARNGRAGDISAIAAVFAALAAAEKGVSTADVTSAQTLTAKEIEALKASLKRALGRDVEIRTDVDPGLMGGLIVQVGSRMFDSSLRTQVEGLRSAMKEA